MLCQRPPGADGLGAFYRGRGWEEAPRVHEACALFSPQLDEKGLADEVRRALSKVVDFCFGCGGTRRGANLSCAVSGRSSESPWGCQKFYHIACAAAAGCAMDASRHATNNTGLFCPQHRFLPEADGAVVAPDAAPWARA